MDSYDDSTLILTQQYKIQCHCGTFNLWLVVGNQLFNVRLENPCAIGMYCRVAAYEEINIFQILKEALKKISRTL